MTLCPPYIRLYDLISRGCMVAYGSQGVGLATDRQRIQPLHSRFDSGNILHILQVTKPYNLVHCCIIFQPKSISNSVLTLITSTAPMSPNECTRRCRRRAIFAFSRTVPTTSYFHHSKQSQVAHGYIGQALALSDTLISAAKKRSVVVWLFNVHSHRYQRQTDAVKTVITQHC